LLAVTTKSRLTAVVSMGVIGYGIALLFVFYGAPDVAMTQFTIDTLTVILFVLVLYRLPRFFRLSSNAIMARDAVIALAAGSLVTFMILLVNSFPNDSALSDYFLTNSSLLAHGQNVVNVILVDFRGIDTMVEITVLAVAAIGVYSLMKYKQA
jgi:multicomponent Na+:H+ antiporter subunit A